MKSNKTKKSHFAALAAFVIIVAIVIAYNSISNFRLRSVEPSENIRTAVDLYEKDTNVYHIINTYEKIFKKYPASDAPVNDNELLCYNKLDDDEKEIYDNIYYSATNFDYLVIEITDQDVQGDSVSDEFTKRLKNALTAFRYDHPEIFWLGGIDNYRVDGNCFFADFHYYFSECKQGYSDIEFEKFSKQKAEFDSRLKSIKSEIKSKCGNDEWGNALYICKWICDNVSYDNKLAERIISSDIEETAENDVILGGGIYSVVVNNTGVCRGYSELYKVVMNYIGIPCTTIFGNLSDADNKESRDKSNHEWNIAKINGSYCNIDVTNMDTQNEDIGYDFSYFGASDKDLAKTHKRITHFDFQQCSNDANNFFVHEGLYGKALNSEDIRKAIQYALDNNLRTACIRYSDNALAMKAYEKFVKNDRVVENLLLEFDRKYDDEIHIDDTRYYMTYVDEKAGIFYIDL